MAYIYGDLIRAQLQSSATDLTPTATGLIYFNSASSVVKWYTGSAWKTAVDTNSSQTLTSKSMSGDSNTISNIGISSLKTVLADANKVVVRDSAGAVVSALLSNSNVATGANIDAAKLGTGIISNTEFNYLDGVTSSIQTQLNAKQATITGAATSISSADLTASVVLVSDATGKVAASAVTSTELGYLSGVTSSIQTQLNSKLDSANGAVSTVASSNLSPNLALISNSQGKIWVSTATEGELACLSGVTSSVQTQINNKEPRFITLPISKGGTNSSISLSNNRLMISSGGAIVEHLQIVASRALISNADGIPTHSNTTSTELGYLSGVTSNVQTQINSKQSTISLTASRAAVSDASGNIVSSSVTSTELGYLSGVTSNVQTQINSKQATITGAASTITSSTLAPFKALTSDVNGRVAASTISLEELGYLSGVTSSIQTQFSGKSDFSEGGGTIDVASITFSMTSGSQPTAGTLTYKWVKNGLSVNLWWRFIGTPVAGAQISYCVWALPKSAPTPSLSLFPGDSQFTVCGSGSAGDSVGSFSTTQSNMYRSNGVLGNYNIYSGGANKNGTIIQGSLSYYCGA